MDVLAYLIGLPVLAGMNPYATAFTLGALLRAGAISSPVLQGPLFAQFASNEWLVIFGVLATLHALADKVPLVSHLNDFVHALLKPFAGAVLAFASIEALQLDRGLPLVVLAAATVWGAGVALTTHVARAGTRLLVTKASFGLATPILSTLEDVVVVLGVGVAALSPALFLALALCGVYAAIVVIRRFIRWGRQVTETAASGTSDLARPVRGRLPSTFNRH